MSIDDREAQGRSDPEGIIPAVPQPGRRRQSRQQKSGISTAPKATAAQPAAPVGRRQTDVDADEAVLSPLGDEYDFGVDFEDDLAHPERLTRRSLKDGADQSTIQIPERLKKPGWDYEWKTLKVLNEPATAGLSLEWNQGWRPVPARDVREILPPGYRRRTVEDKGFILMMRPLRLSMEARQELRQRADEQKIAKMRQAAGVPDDMRGIINRNVDAFQVVGEIGTHRPKEEADPSRA